MRIIRRSNSTVFVCALIAAAMSAGLFAQGRGAGAATNNFYRFNYSLDDMQPINYPAQPITTQHEIKLAKETIKYTAHVGFIPLRHATSGASEGHLFYVYYAKDGVTDKSKRPVWFLFNGGPGAATIRHTRRPGRGSSRFAGAGCRRSKRACERSGCAAVQSGHFG